MMIIAGRPMYASSDSDFDKCQQLIKLMRQEGKCMIGRTKILYRADQHRNMELYKTLAWENLCMRLISAFIFPDCSCVLVSATVKVYFVKLKLNRIRKHYLSVSA